MMGFHQRVRKVVDGSTVVLEVLDARFPEATRNRDLEQRVEKRGKKLILVLNKADLISRSAAKQLKKQLEGEHKVVFVSARKRTGISLLRKAILSSRSRGELIAGIVGYPNTGKSSLVNVLHGRRVAKTAQQAGFTKGEQWVKLGGDIKLIDTPGVIPYEERTEKWLVIVGARSGNQIKDPVTAAETIIELVMETNPEGIAQQYGVGVTKGKDPSWILEAIALSRKKMRKGNVADTGAMARIIIADWQHGILQR